MIATNLAQNVWKYTRQKWQEFFVIVCQMEYLTRTVHQGTRLPPFYLPVYRKYETNAIIAWIFPLAPFVLIFLLVKELCRTFWFWAIDWVELLRFNNSHDEQNP